MHLVDLNNTIYKDNVTIIYIATAPNIEVFEVTIMQILHTLFSPKK
jgi:hypothetical protein